MSSAIFTDLTLASDPLEFRSQTTPLSVLIIVLLQFFLRSAVALYPGCAAPPKKGVYLTWGDTTHVAPVKGLPDERALWAEDVYRGCSTLSDRGCG